MEDEKGHVDPNKDQLPRSSARALLQFVGSISADDLRLMKDAIEEGCERIVLDPEGDDCQL
jgi:hypothetical protein